MELNAETLMTLDLGGCSKLTQRTILLSIRECENLCELNLSGVPAADDESLQPLRNLFKLHTLSLSNCTGIRDETMSLLPDTRLRKLDLSHNKQLTHVGIQECLTQCDQLEEVNLTRCANVQISEVLQFIKERITMMGTSNLFINSKKARALMQSRGKKFFVFKLRTINLYGCKGISRATERALWGKLKSVEMSLSEYVVKAFVNPKPPRPFFGLRLFSDAKHEVSRNKAYKFYEYAYQSSVQMQCMFRARQSRILHRKMKRAYDAAVLKTTRVLQRLFRGYQGRQRWNQEQRRQHIERLMERRGAKTVQRAFRAYRKRRDGYFFAHSLFRVWRLWTKTQRKVRVYCRWLLKMRRQFRPLWKKHAIKAERVAWAGLREVVAASKRRKQHLVGIWLNTVPLKTHNSIRQQRQRAQARKLLLHTWGKHTMFQSVREFLEICHRQMRKAIDHWRLSSQKSFWRKWRSWLAEYKALKALLASKEGRADHHYHTKLKQHSFKILKLYLAKRRIKRAKLRKALNHWRSRFSTWSFELLRKAVRLQVVGRIAVRIWIRRGQSYGFRALRAGAEYQKRQRYNMVLAVRHLFHTKKRLVFRGMWRWVNRGRILPLLMFRLKRERVLAKWWVQWDRATQWLANLELEDAEAYRRQMQLRKELMLNLKRRRYEGATLIQSIWRGVTDRKFAAYRKDFLVRKVIRIQTMARRKLGTLAVYRARRLKRLLGFIKREHDCDQMTLEDERSHQHRTFLRHLTNIQRMYRGRLGKIKAFRRLQYVVRQRALKERERSQKQREEAKERALKREEEAALRDLMATMIQSLWRQKKAYDAFLHMLYLVHQIKYSIKLQAFYRGRLARKKAAGLKRARWIDRKMKARRAFTGKFFRFFGLKKRKQQNAARQFMQENGIYPGTYCLTGDTLKKELKEDWTEFKYHVRAFFHHWRSLNHKSEWISINRLDMHVDQMPLMWDSWKPVVSKYDPVQILKADHVRSGETGFVLNFEGDGSFGTKAVVKMDTDGEIICIANYHRVYKLGVKPSLRKIEPMWQRTFTPDEIKANKLNIIQRAQELSIWYRDYRAARMLQRVVRLRRGRKRVRTIRRLYHAALDRKRMCLYRFLRRLHIAYAGTGRTLVKFRLVKPENVPEMPENDAFDLKGYQRKIQAQLNVELDEMFTKHHGDLLKDIARGVVKEDEVLRWRRRNQRNLLFSKIKSFFNKHVFFKMAEKLMLDAEKIDLSDPDATESRFLKVLAKVFGGKDFMYDKDDRRAWAGVHSFKDMSRSPHVVHNKWFPVTGTAIVHGVWVDDVPHGEGTIWFPTGTTLNGDVFAKPVDWELQLRDRTGDTGGRRGEKARRWKQYEEIFCKNIEKGNIAGKHVIITYRNGERYEGPFVPYGRQPPREHRGVWFKTNGWEYRGANVTNHFDSTRITGYYTVKTSKGSTYDGCVHLNKRHGYGRMRFANGNEYSGEWRLGIKHGFGTFKDTEGNIYTGDWVNDKMHGVGLDRRADGRIYNGTIVDGKWHQNGVLRVPSKRFPNSGSGMDQYTAYFQFGFVHGEGELLFANGDRYVGPFRKNMRKGVGVCYFASKERYEGPYLNDEMHGVGHWIKPRGSAHDEIRIGLWKEGFHRRWLGYAVSKLITTEFLRRINEEGLDSPFAEFIVEKIPDLPQGVDSNDPQVKELVEQIMRRQGPDASRLMMQKTQTEHTKQAKFLAAGKREHDIAHQRLRDTTMQLQKQRRIVLEQKRLLEELKKDKTRLERQIERFWVDDDYENRKKFLKTLPPIQTLSRQDWYRLSSAPDVNDALKALLVVGVCSLLGLPNTWKEVQLLCGDSDQNRIANDRDAFLYTYANKFVFLSQKFDPFVVAQDEDKCEILEKVRGGWVGGWLTE